MLRYNGKVNVEPNMSCTRFVVTVRNALVYEISKKENIEELLPNDQKIIKVIVMQVI